MKSLTFGLALVLTLACATPLAHAQTFTTNTPSGYIILSFYAGSWTGSTYNGTYTVSVLGVTPGGGATLDTAGPGGGHIYHHWSDPYTNGEASVPNFTDTFTYSGHAGDTIGVQTAITFTDSGVAAVGGSYTIPAATRTLTVAASGSTPASGYTNTFYTFTATPSAGTGTITWSADGFVSSSGYSATYNWSAAGSKTVSATIASDGTYGSASGFCNYTVIAKAPDTYSVTTTVSTQAAANAGCNASASPSSGITAGDASTLTATPASGWTFSGWTANPAPGTFNPSNSAASTQLTNIQANYTVTANFTAIANVDGSIAVSPTSSAAPGSTTVTWSTSNATSVSVVGTGVSSSAASGSQAVTGLAAGSYTYTLTAQGAGGPVTKTATFTVANVSGSIAASPASATAPGATTVSWSTSNATSVSVSGTGVSSAAASGSQAVSGLAAGTYTYTLTAQGPGGPITQTATFTVSSAASVSGSISASPASGTAPGATTISWSTSNATSVSVSGTGVSSSAASGSQAVSGLAAGTYTYTLTAQGAGGPITRTATFTSGGQVDAYLGAGPTNPTVGSSVLLSWGVTNGTSFTITAPGMTTISGTTGGGMQSVPVNALGPITYTLTAQGQGGPITRTATVTVVAVTGNVTASITATVTTPNDPGQATVSWTTTNATSVLVSGEVMDGSPWATLTSYATNISLPAGTYTWTLWANGPGGPITRTATATINQTAAFRGQLTALPASSYYPGGPSSTVSWTTTNCGYVLARTQPGGPGGGTYLNSSAPNGSSVQSGLLVGSTQWALYYCQTFPTNLQVHLESVLVAPVNPNVTFTFGNLTQVYDGTPKYATVTPSVAGAPYSNSYTPIAPTTDLTNTAAGSYTITATASGMYSGSGSATLTIQPKPVAFTITNLNFTYDGAAHAATVTPSDGSATYAVSYTGTNGTSYGPSATPPSLGGAYTVTATATGNYSGTNSATLTITQLSQTVTISPPTANVNAGDSVTFTAAGAQNAYVWGGSASGSGATQTVTFPTAGTATVTVQSPAGGNFTASNVATSNVTVNPVATTFTFAPTAFTYNGAAQSPTITPSPAGATYTTTGPASATAAGSYAFTVTATGNYTGSGNCNWSIAKATPTITWTAPAAITYGTPLSATQLNATASVPGSFVYTPASGTVLSAGAGQPLNVAFTPTDSANYTTANAATTITVNPAAQAPLTLSPLTAQTYATARTFTAGGGSGSGAVTDTLASGPATRTAALTYTANSGTTGYNVSLTKAADANYTARTDTFAIPVTQAAATVTLGNLNQTYDGTPKNATVSTTPSGLTVNLTYNGGATAPTVAGSYAVVGTVSDSNYTGSASGTLVIAKATPTVAWSAPADITYGTALSAMQLNATANVPGSFVYTPAVGTVLNAGAGQLLNVTFTPTDTTNYTTASAATLINVNPAAQAPLTLSPLTAQAYATARTFIAGGGSGSGTITDALASGPATRTATLTYTANNGTTGYTVALTKAGDANYTARTDTFAIPVTQASLTATANNQSKVYGAANPALTISYSGFVNGDTAASLAVPPTASTPATSGSAVGSYTITPAGGSSPNYSFSYVNGTLTVTAATVTPSVTASSKVYDNGTTATITGRSLAGVIGADAVTLTGGSGSFASKTVGTGQTVTVTGLALSGAAAGNYQLSSTTATTTADITAKNLTTTGVTAANKVYDGTTVATLNWGSAALIGVVGGDLASLVTTGATGTFSDKNVANGKTVTVAGLALNGADSGNYSLTQPSAIANITQATPTITWTAPAAITYGTALSATQLDATASVPGSFVYAQAAGTMLNAGAGQALTVAFTPTDTTNYTTASGGTTITVNKADQIVTLTPLASTVLLGTPIAYTAAGSSTGAYAWGGNAGASGSGASQTVNLAGGPGNYTVTVYAPGNSNYNDSPLVNATIVMQAPTLTLSLTPLVSNYTVTDTSSPLNGKTYKRTWQDSGTWHAYLGRSGEQFQIVGQGTTAVQAFELQALEPNADPSAWYSLATIAPPTGATNGPGVSVTGVFSVSLDTASTAAALVPQSYAQGNPKTGVWQLRARPQDSSGTLSDWSNIVAVTVDLPLTTAAIPAQSLPPAGPIGGWFTASDQTNFNLTVWIP